MRRAILEAVLEAKSAGVPAVLATQLRTGEQALVLPDRKIGDLTLDPGSLAEARRLLAADLSLTIDGEEGRIFLKVLSPPARLIIVGAVHIAEPLARMAESAGYSIVLVDPRERSPDESSSEGFTVIDDWPDEALAKLRPDERTAVVTLTHDPKLDDPALRSPFAPGPSTSAAWAAEKRTVRGSPGYAPRARRTSNSIASTARWACRSARARRPRSPFPFSPNSRG